MGATVRVYRMGTGISPAGAYSATGDHYFHVTAGYQADFLNYAETIIAADTSGERLAVSGDRTLRYPAATVFRVRESTGNDGTWTVATGGAAVVGSQTYLTVTGNITSATADGSIGLTGRKFYSSLTQNPGWFTLEDVYLGIKCAALNTAPSAGAVLTQATTGATLTIVGSDTTNDLIWGVATGTWDATNTFTKTSGTGTLDPSPCTPSAITTTVKVAETLTNTGMDSGALYLADYLDLWGAVVPEWSMPGERVRLRSGLYQRTVPVGMTRAVIGAELQVDMWEIDKHSYNGLRALDFIRQYCIDSDDELLIFSEVDTYDVVGDAVTEKFYYKGSLMEVPPILFSTRVFKDDSDPLEFTVPLHVTEDGEFADIDDPTSIAPRSRS